MSNLFKITYKWEKRSEPYRFDEEDYVDITVVDLCLERFLSLYEGTFVVHINDFDLLFDLHSDFSIIFEELPEVLEALTANTDSPVELYFAEQGTELIFQLARQADTISIRFVKGPGVGRRFADLPESIDLIAANVFLSEWVRFTQAVLDALVALQPDLTSDQSYQEYRDRLVALESAG
jgi:hypothetical protein